MPLIALASWLTYMDDEGAVDVWYDSFDAGIGFWLDTK